MDELFVVEAYKWRIRGLSTMTLTDSVSVEQTTKSDPTEVFDIDSQDSYRGDGECEKPYWDDAIDEYIRCSNNDTFKTTCSKYKLICTIDQENHYAAQRKNFVRFALYRVEDINLSAQYSNWYSCTNIGDKTIHSELKKQGKHNHIMRLYL
ncbi:8346_t:CDS:2 [Entrophospora sp. SA101]|nr:8346_t:CDS:2 [Entrophospora sp. SA101]